MAGGENSENTQGLGDAVVLLKYKVTAGDADAANSVWLGAGPKMPLGRTNFNNSSDLILPADMQPGSGAWDVLLWGNYTGKRVIWPNLSATALGTYALKGTNPSYNEVQEYKFGNELLGTAGLAYRLVVKKLLLDPNVSLQYRRTEPDEIDGGLFPNTGGQWINVIPGLTWNINSNVQLRASARIPVYRNLTGTQVTTSYRTNVGVWWRIPSKNSSTHALDSINPEG